MTTRVRAHRPLHMLALAASAALLMAACTGDDEQASAEATAAATATATAAQEATTPAVWASDVCGAIAAWEDSIRTIAADTEDGISKDALSEKLTEAEQATQDLASQLVAIGVPETDDGKKAQQDIEKLSSDMQAGIEDIKSQVDALEGSGVEGIRTGLDAIKGDIEGLLKDVKHTFHNIRQLEPANELSTAIKSDETCQTLRPEE